jgi:DNA-binding response OmpR family regulator
MAFRPEPRFPDLPSGPNPNLSKVKVLVCESSGIIRQAIRMGFQSMGIRDVVEVSTLHAAHAACSETVYHILILNQQIEGHDTTFVLREIRAGTLGVDPFVLAVMLLASRDEVQVRSAINSGSDDLLLIPFAPDQLTSRLKVLIERRKSFVVTHDYIGPDRRGAPRPGAPTARQIAVPNPVASCTQGHSPDRYERLKQDGRDMIFSERIKRLRAAIAWEGNTLVVSAREGTITSESVYRALARIESFGEELQYRSRSGTPAEGLAAMLAEVQRLKSNGGMPPVETLDALAQAGRKIAGAPV